MENKRNMAIAAGAVAGVVAIVLALVLMSKTDAPGDESADVEPAGHWSEAPEIWKSPADAESVAVEIDPERGPLVRVAPSQAVAITPEIDGVQLAWEVGESSDERWTVLGKGAFGDSRVVAVWEFAQGNPQALFSLTIEEAPIALMSEGLDATLELPAGDVRLLDEGMRIVGFSSGPKRLSGWTPGWLRWTGTGRTIELSSWWANHVTVSQTDASAVRIVLNLVDPEAMSVFSEECATDSIALHSRMKMSMGSLPIVVPGRLPAGAEAAVMPVFIPPKAHFNTAFEEVEEHDPAAWSSQAATLALGHSSPEDPRFGNGGLSGAHLGGTIVTPEAAKGAEIDALGSRLEDTRVQFEPATGPTFGRPACSKERIWLRDATRFEAGFSNSMALDSSVAFHGTQPTSLAVEVLDGTREQLLEQAFSRLYLERLRRERGVFVFASPLVATRNPLTTAAKEALLVPERHGQWTLAPELVRAFADIELWREANSSVIFASVETALGTWARARACDFQIRASGELRIACPGPLESLTFIADGSHVPRHGEQTLEHEVRDPTKRPQTWGWTSMGEEPMNIGLSVENPPRGVRWVIPAR